MKKSTTDEFVEKAKKIHGDKYDYSLVNYVNNTTPVKIVCPTHGVILQTPKSHLRGNGCQLCGYIKNSEKHKKQREPKLRKEKKRARVFSTEQFIAQAKEIHKEKYDYSKVNYINNHTKVCIICPEHGEFWQTPTNHLMGKGCAKCGGKTKINENEFKKTLFLKYPHIELLKYNGYRIKSLFFCHNSNTVGIEHGEFTIVPHDLVDKRQKCSCPKCVSEQRRRCFVKDKEQFVNEAQDIHGKNRYDYSKVDYINRNEKVCIICHEKDEFGNEHGEFWQTPANHLKTRGCPLCKNDRLVYENKLYAVLLDIFKPEEIIRQYRNEEILGSLSLDFYIPKYKIAIEHQGSQHFHPVPHFGGIRKYNALKENDKIKYDICKKNNVYLLYFSYEKYWVSENYIDKVYTDIKELKNIIYKLISSNNE